MERPGYLRIADDLRAGIEAGTYPAETRLPTLAELADQYDVSVSTVRGAIKVLLAEGRVETRTKAGTIVRSSPAIHRVAGDRYKKRPVPSTAFTADQGIGWSEYRLDKRFTHVRAGDELAVLFEVEPGEPLLARHFLFYDDGAPQQMSSSYVRWSDVAGTPVADPIHEPWPGGTPAQLASLGIVVAQVTEAVTARLPTAGEADALKISSSVPVFAITRRMLTADGRVVEVAHPIVRPADRTILDYTIDI
ncbi:GntR family transcriptional regulator [Embleya sp. NBC_00896]|uniref:GntR family transcriptional regulator n=1 Tax=Embleya sp. NBC_00896 TaxID=2975961 RepID=UPI002F90891E|nr:GntR family transcriptional regulator [Embleya sp. NBC_00896]